MHASDIHLDSPLRSLALRDSALADLIGNATRRAFVRIVDLCLDEQVDALLLAGDLYDGHQTSMKTARFLAEQLRRLDEAGIRTFVIRGNHDALSRITKELVLPDSVKVFGGRAEAIAIPADDSKAQVPIVIHGLSFIQPHAPESLLSRYRPPVEGAVNVGLLHTSLAGAPGHDPYAPCSVADLDAAGFSYWALGHVHKRMVRPGRCTIVMPGMTQGRDINEAGPKSVSLVTVGEDRSIHVEERVTSIAQFERVFIDATDIDDWPLLVRELARALERTRAGVVSDHLVARLCVTGTTSLGWRMRRDLDLLKAEVDSRASALGRCWVEKLEIDCRMPGMGPGASAAGISAVAPLLELRRLVDQEVLGSEAFLAAVTEIAEELRAQLPHECRDLLGSDEAAFNAAVAELIHDGTDDVLSRLYTGADAADR